MNIFILNIFLAFGFSAVVGQFNLTGVSVGFAVGYLALWLTKPLYGQTRYFQRVPKVLGLLVYFVRELIVSNARVLWDVVTPAHISKPGIIGIPLDAESDLEISLVANLISLTPGTLSLDLSGDRQTLYVHVMFLDDVEGVRKSIKEGLERRVLEAMR